MVNRFQTHPSWLLRLCGKYFQYLPRGYRTQLLRQALRLPQRLDPQLQIKLAETQEEFVAAFRLVHNSDVKHKIASPEPSGLRVTPYHALPMTKTVIATLNGEVVATVSLAPDSQYGTPMTNTFDLSSLRRSDRRIVEVFGLAVDHKVRCSYNQLLFPLFKYVFHLLEKSMNADYAVVAVQPRLWDLFESVLLFNPLAAGDKGYGFVNGLPMVGAYLNVKTYRLALAAQYKNAPVDQNPLAFLTYSFANFKLPPEDGFKLIEPSMNPEVLDYFFNKRTNIFSRLHPEKIDNIASLYNMELYEAVFPQQAEVKRRASMIAREPRFAVDLQARMISLDGRMMQATLYDVSLTGFKAEVKEKLNFGEHMHVTIAIGDSDMVDVRAVPVRQGSDTIYGFQIAQSQQGWKYFMQLLEQERMQQEFNDGPSWLLSSKAS